jgi:ATP-dependent exoDNAse (exonuclease V) beta subunit
MTIHKSKGLEFPVVIFPFAEEDYLKKPKDKLWLTTNDDSLDLPKVLIDNNKAVEGFGEEAKLIYDQKKQEELLDNVNVLYVALTRAEEQLYIISNKNLTAKGEAKDNNMSSFYIKYLENQGVYESEKLVFEFGSAVKLSAITQHIDTSQLVPTVKEVLDFKNIKIAQREALMWGTHQQESIEYGTIIHQILSYITIQSDIDRAVEKAIEEGLIHFGQKKVVLKSLQDVVNHQELSVFFEKGMTVFNEQTIIQKQGAIVKPDRMVLNSKNEIYLLDYKTGLHSPKYIQQLIGYQDAIELIGYKVVKKALVYIGDAVEVVQL